MTCMPSVTPSSSSVSGPLPRNLPLTARTQVEPASAKPLGAAASTASRSSGARQRASQATAKVTSPLTFLMLTESGLGSFCRAAFRSASSLAFSSASALAFSSASSLALRSASSLALRCASSSATRELHASCFSIDHCWPNALRNSRRIVLFHFKKSTFLYSLRNAVWPVNFTKGTCFRSSSSAKVVLSSHNRIHTISFWTSIWRWCSLCITGPL
mmetsp:Transcript_87618/g.272201  ORF Transcript_87618/g.272201 Transcript_87618/m.272201 type:complete len:215 (+) Transcript_87618:99-743(+)